jgi:hypothetical protein
MGSASSMSELCDCGNISFGNYLFLDEGKYAVRAWCVGAGSCLQCLERRFGFNGAVDHFW